MFNATRVSYLTSSKISKSGTWYSSSTGGDGSLSTILVILPESSSPLSTTTISGSTSFRARNSTKDFITPATTSITAISTSSTFISDTPSAVPSDTPSAVPSDTPSALPSDTTSASPSTSMVSSTSRTVKRGKTVVSYTRSYIITESSTTFTTQLSRVSVLGTQEAATFSAPTAAATTDLAFYNRWLSGTLDSGQFSGSVSSGHRNTIIASVVGSVGGFLLAALIIWAMFFWRRKRRVNTTRGFSHEIGCRLDDPSEMADNLNSEQNHHATNLSSNEDEEFLKGKYSSFGRKLPLWHKNDDKLKKDTLMAQPRVPERSQANPFQDEFDFQKRLPLPPPVPTQDLPLHSSFSYASADTSSVSDAGSDSSSSIQLSRPNAVARSTQSFLRELL
ncbi:LAME_0F16908g1_1 [Lachancea meyersii CBS 8951]|uniref:LAME_0F16908g1_1 n=1 Tax=Lachancea meyersii CBS 8951 TaxID=1266667 RepID=A0A1G4JZI2_9SACH|nr:LAME_0F16908g1_1 [Lachancea meyersii CBS 8951]